MLLQAYDFLELSRRYDACLQLGEYATMTPLQSTCYYIPSCNVYDAKTTLSHDMLDTRFFFTQSIYLPSLTFTIPTLPLPQTSRWI